MVTLAYQRELFPTESHRADPLGKLAAPDLVLACFARERPARTLREFCEERLADDLLWSVARRVRELRNVVPMEIEPE
jgi:hypothetical protein